MATFGFLRSPFFDGATEHKCMTYFNTQNVEANVEEGKRVAAKNIIKFVLETNKTSTISLKRNRENEGKLESWLSCRLTVQGIKLK